MRYLMILLLMSVPVFTMAQVGDAVEMADTFRAHGKIYVVLAVVLILLVGLFLYMITLDNKITRLEKDKKDKV